MAVVGVVDDVKYDLMAEPLLDVYVPAGQQPGTPASIVMRTAVEPGGIMGPARDAIRAIDPDLPVEFSVLQDRIHRAGAGSRFEIGLLSALGLAAVLLAALGTYGVMAFVVSQRRREFGIRIALGAVPQGLQANVIRRGLLMAAMGGLLGLLAAFGLGRVISSQLVGVTPYDAGTMGVVATVIAAVSVVASYLPARRASAVNASEALRSD